jgi:hypothetical protein
VFLHHNRVRVDRRRHLQPAALETALVGLAAER